MSFPMLALVCFVFGIGFGYLVQRAGLCFAAGLGEMFAGRGKRILRLFLTIFVISCAGFLISGYFNESLGLKPIGQIRGYGFFNLVAGMLFGAGILMNGGCILGTLRQIGEGNMTFLIVLVSFIPGMALVVYGLNPLIESGYDVKKVLLPELLGVSAPYVCAVLIAGALVWLWTIRRRK